MKYRIVKKFDSWGQVFWYKFQKKKWFWHTVYYSTSKSEAIKFMLDYMQGKKTVWEEEIK
jgi:hypothetical protein